MTCFKISWMFLCSETWNFWGQRPDVLMSVCVKSWPAGQSVLPAGDPQFPEWNNKNKTHYLKIHKLHSIAFKMSQQCCCESSVQSSVKPVMPSCLNTEEEEQVGPSDRWPLCPFPLLRQETETDWGFFTCLLKSAPYQALHDWLPRRSPRVPVLTEEGGGRQRWTACRTGEGAASKIGLNSRAVCDYHFQGGEACWKKRRGILISSGLTHTERGPRWKTLGRLRRDWIQPRCTVRTHTWWGAHEGVFMRRQG